MRCLTSDAVSLRILDGLLISLVSVILVAAPYVYSGFHAAPTFFFVEAASALGVFILVAKKVLADPGRFSISFYHVLFAVIALYMLLQLSAASLPFSNLMASQYAYGTREALFAFTSFAFVFALVSHLARYPGILTFIFYLLITNALVISLVGVLQWLSGTEKVFWLKSGESVQMFATFRNHSHYAAYVGMVLPLNLSLILVDLRGIFRWRDHDPEASGLGIYMRGVFEGNLGFLILAFVVNLGGLFLSLSRSAIIALALAFLFYFLVARRMGLLSGRLGPWVGVMAFITVLLILWVDPRSVWIRLLSLTRVDTYAGHLSLIFPALGMWKVFFWFGSGFGTFRSVFTTFIPEDWLDPGKYFVSHLSNAYVHVLSEGGVVGFLLVGFGIFFLGREARLVVRRDEMSRGEKLIALGMITSFVFIACQSLVSFSLRIPSIALLFTVLLGLWVGRFSRDLLSLGDLRLNRFLAIAILMISVVVLARYTEEASRAYRAHRYLVRDEKTSWYDRDRNSLQDAKMAIEVDPGNAEYRYLAAILIERQAKKGGWPGMLHWEKALQYLLRAVELDPWRRDYRVAVVRLCDYMIKRDDVSPETRQALEKIREEFGWRGILGHNT